MTRTLALLAVLAAPVQAVPSLESLSAGAVLAAPAPTKAFKAQRHVSLNGDVRLSGNGFVPHNGGFVSIPLSGTVRVYGDGGKVTGDGRVNEYVSVWVREGSNYISQFVSVNASVSLYSNGRYVGMTTVHGSVHVSGWASGSWLRLDGSGSVSGSAFISDESPKN
ncbi:MAG: hypothetical protein HY928_06200 [Elusimicrobia bacterium]|nr:hypothetical protein [Elusimicrobiota bacterium]